MSADSDFQLSRIYAQGWNAAGKLTAAQSAVLETQGLAALNPYADGPQRARWAEGFGRALGNGNKGSENKLPFRSAAMSGKPPGARP